MPNPVVHFEIIGRDPDRLRDYYAQLFGWTYDTSNPVSDQVSDPNDYGFISPGSLGDVQGIPGGVGGGAQYAPGHVFYVAVPDVEQALHQAVALGGTRVLGPARAATGLIVGHFTDPEGNRIGLAQLPSAD